MNNKIWIYLIIIISFAASCSPASRLQRENKSQIRNLLKEKLKIDKDLDYSLERMRVDMEGMINVSGNGKLYIKRNEYIFLTVQMLGFEIARAMVTTDSIYYINRLERKYLFASMKDVQNKYSRRIDYNLIQNLLIKGLVIPARVKPGTLSRFISKNDNNYFFTLSNGGQSLIFKYDELMYLQNIEIYYPEAQIFMNSEIFYQNSSPSDIKLNGSLGKTRIKARIIPGNIGNKHIIRPIMSFNNNYSEIAF